MTNGEDTLKYRVEKLELAVDRMDCKLDKVMENHLPHLQSELEKLRSDIRINSWRIATITAIGSAILSTVATHILKGL